MLLARDQDRNSQAKRTGQTIILNFHLKVRLQGCQLLAFQRTNNKQTFSKSWIIILKDDNKNEERKTISNSWNIILNDDY